MSANAQSKNVKRRDFIAAGAATAAAGTLASTAEANAEDAKLVVAVMGMSRGRSLADTFSKHSDCVIKYVCDVDKTRAERAADEIQGKVGYRPEPITTWETFVEDDEVDIVACAAPNHWHAPATIVAAEAGKHVYVEKPCCQNPWEGEMQIAAARKNKVCVQIGTQRRSAPTYREAIEFIHGGGIGTVHSARCVYFSARTSIGEGKNTEVPEHIDYDRWQGPVPRRPFQDNLVHYNWHWVWFYGNGELGNNGIHSLDIARWALNVDFPKTVSSTGGRYYFDDDQETPDTQIVSFEFENETQITWQGSSCNRNGSGFVKVFGDNGMVEFLGGGGYVVYDRGNKEVKRVTGGQGQPEHIDNLVKSIRASDPEGLNAEIEIGHRSTLLCHLGNISQRVGRILNCDTSNGHILDDEEAMALWQRDYHEGWEDRLTIG
tara:strand:+ start:116 stop:1414 length:1299 start_codon:yes stop_codon:yes gene_type:complete